MGKNNIFPVGDSRFLAFCFRNEAPHLVLVDFGLAEIVEVENQTWRCLIPLSNHYETMYPTIYQTIQLLFCGKPAKLHQCCFWVVGETEWRSVDDPRHCSVFISWRLWGAEGLVSTHIELREFPKVAVVKDKRWNNEIRSLRQMFAAIHFQQMVILTNVWCHLKRDFRQPEMSQGTPHWEERPVGWCPQCKVYGMSCQYLPCKIENIHNNQTKKKQPPNTTKKTDRVTTFMVIHETIFQMERTTFTLRKLHWGLRRGDLRNAVGASTLPGGTDGFHPKNWIWRWVTYIYIYDLI